MKIAYIDFEFNGTKEEILNLVCVSILANNIMMNFWLYNNPSGWENLKKYLLALKDEGYTFNAYNVEAEASCFYSLGLNPSDFKWIDSFLEYRCLLNNSNKLSYGKQLIDGYVRETLPPESKYSMNEEQRKKARFDKPSDSLASAVFKLLGIKIDTDYKKTIRDMIIRNDSKAIMQNKESIMDYCASDVVHLPNLLSAIFKEYDDRIYITNEELIKFMLLRGDYATRSAKQVRRGYPVNVEWLRNLADNVPLIINECILDINSQFPDNKPFRWKPKELKFSMNTKVIKDWIRKNHDVSRWMKTDSGDISLQLDAFTEHYHFRHDFPRYNYGAQILRFLKLKQAMYGFIPSSKGGKTIFDYLGSDGKVRPYMNIYGSQSARTQPSSISFIPLKSAWTRSLIQPPKGKCIGAIDFKSQEFLIKGLIAHDLEMIKAYESSDVYLYFAKMAGEVPLDGKREDYEEIRELFKSTVLGLSYLMSKYGLSAKLTADTGKEVDEDGAQEYIDMFNEIFPDQSEWNEDIVEKYLDDGFIMLEDGWFMWGDNTNHRSVTNIPIQGAGSVIMRRAVALAEILYNLEVIFTLHDAIYILFDMGDLSAMDKLAKCMKQAFKEYFEGTRYAHKANVKLDGNIWGEGLQNIEYTTENGFKLKGQDIYIDSRAKNEYKLYSPYFRKSELTDIL